MSVASPGALPGNILSLADQDFEGSTGTWGPQTNASAVSLSAAWSFTGSDSLSWTALAAGNTSVATGFYAVQAKQAYVASLIVNPAVSRVCAVGVNWYNGTTFLSGSSSTVSVSGATPLNLRTVAPATATQVKVWAQVQGAALGELEQVDLVYFAPAVAQVLVDWVNPAMTPTSAAGNAFFDLTPWVDLVTGISLSSGRKDAINEVPPGAASFPVFNSHGWFTVQSNLSPFYPNVDLGRRVQVNRPDETGAWHTRFDGAISAIDYTFTDNGQSTAIISAADVMAQLNREQGLSCWTKETVLADKPVLHWTLDDAQGSILAGESSGNNGPPLRLRTYGTGAAMSFGDNKTGIETGADNPGPDTPGPFTSPLTSAYFTVPAGTSTDLGFYNGPSSQLSGPIPLFSVQGNWSLEWWFTLDAANQALYGSTTQPAMTMVSLGDTRSGRNLNFGLFSNLGGTGGAPFFNAGQFTVPPATFLSSFHVNPHQHVANLQGGSLNPLATFAPGGMPIHMVAVASGGLVTFYCNTVQITTLTIPAGTAVANWIDIGGCFGGYGGMLGNISMVSLYNYNLSMSQITNHYQVGWHGNYRQGSGTVVSNLANLAGIAPFWVDPSLSSNGLAVTEYFDITGQNALTSMQAAEAAELAGLLYVSRAGQLKFDGRNVRMGLAATTVTLPAGAFGSALGYRVTDQQLVDQASLQTQAIGKVATAVNVAAAQRYGTYANGTPSNPSSIALLADSPAFGTYGVPSSQGQLDPYLNDAVNWQVNRQSSPSLKPTTLPVDILTMINPASPDYVAPSVILGLEVNQSVSLAANAATALPTDFGALDYVIEGIDELITLKAQPVTFYGTPAKLIRCWKPGDPVYGVLDSTAVIGVSAPDAHAIGPHAKAQSSDPGAPFWPPTYSATMNSGGVSGKGFVGALDQRGIWDTLQKKMQPPILVVAQTQVTQTVANGTAQPPSNLTTVSWDTMYLDTSNGMGLINGWPNWFVVTLPGFWEFATTVLFAVGSAVSSRFVEFVINPFGGIEGPNGSHALYVSAANRRANVAQIPGVSTSTRVYCGIGTTVGVRVWQDSGASISTSLVNGGSMFSAEWLGYSATAD